jgi:Ca2+-binding RTX toxin-like protein
MIAFSSDRRGALELYVMRATGAAQRPLTSGAAPAAGADWQRRIPLDVEFVLPVLAPGAGGRVCTQVGTEGRNTLTGGPQGDVLCGLGGADRITGAAGNDVIIGGPGRDTLLGGAGSDTLYARDRARDVVDGGRGRDTARVDRKRDKVKGVERRF